MAYRALGIREGDSVNYTNAGVAAILYGTVVALVSRIAIALADIAVGKVGALAVRGVWQLPAVNDTAFAMGDQLYWDATAEKLTKVATGNTPAGWCFVAKAQTGTTAQVSLEGGSIVGDPATNGVSFRGVLDCSANPNYPKADSGDLYVVSVAGKIGGASGATVSAGDCLLCKADGTAAGTHATKGAAWSILYTAPPAG